MVMERDYVVLAVLWKASMCLPSVGIRKRLVGWSHEQVVNSLLRLMAKGSVRAQIIGERVIIVRLFQKRRSVNSFAAEKITSNRTTERGF
ncbi:hypothetical protein JCM19037_4862 [Geomicrobium sp. JCM 19037]|uniref:hypothetical protein n=1 Tax=Geomicrobium sp. JCM 19037 TaxID=1460634 RepID=UPI00045F446B|nr:hypothetical protein [Geomicrobium sp. JCM 19037]GAK06277.1 hypothetical protein JCM19037_4862 [Geomicrobium sp. JCM 19037]